MNKRIRSMIDEIFSDMKMTAENLALRDELMANAHSRFEDSVSQGKSEEEAFAEVAASLGDVQGLLEEMNRMDAQSSAGAQEEEIPELVTGAEEAKEEEPAATQTDLGQALDKAFTALGDFSQAIMPEARKLADQMDDATGGMLSKLGRAARKGMRDAQKAAGEAIDRLSKEQGELVFDFGPKKSEPKEEPVSEFEQVVREQPEREAEHTEAGALRSQAESLRAEAAIKEVTGDAEGAQQMRAQADELDTRAEVLEQAEALKEAVQAAESEEPNSSPVVDENGDIDQAAFSKAVEDMAREAEDAVRQAAAAAGETVRRACEEADYIVRGADEPVSGQLSFPAAGLHEIDIQLDADDVEIVAAKGDCVETVWEARNVDGEPVVSLEGHKLTIRRKNPDVFKTFFSVFAKDGGKITVRVPFGYAANYRISTTSGDIMLRDVDVDDVKANTTSGCVRLEPVTSVRAKGVTVTTVSGHATVSACAEDVSVTTVSGDQFISCDALKVDVDVVSGKVHVEGACEEWEINAVSSDVELLCTVAPTKKIQLSTMHATVRLALPDSIRGFAVETSGALGCDVVNEFGANRYGTCALPIRMDTMRGKLLITRL